ncbi:13578_t:CDS:2 [Funneliformis geosporum]|uniref:11693_t:CDS:1 n=1 Tax=Funneliformis geosporum TaxID=1117311 RepID=A0A9W4SU85_9GLOM|nr:11693_t:CDS:2 [Funneliformis geosporum]CAI2181808.1 13578_t:CDS:2 [Funneliformis geosporum]
MTVQSKSIPIQQTSQSFPAFLLALYLQQLTIHPLKTKAITSGVLSGLQELVAQELSGINSFLVSGPLNHVLFEALNKIFRQRTGAGAKLLQILASQLIITPIQNTVYLIAMAVIAGVNTPAQIQKTVKKALLPIMKMSWIVSPLAMGFAQKFLPPQLWVPFFNIVGFVFGVIANTKAKRIQQQKNQDNRDQDERESYQQLQTQQDQPPKN